MDNLEPITRNEMFLNGDDLEPITREEMILAGADLEPLTRHEWFLKKYRGGGGGGGYDLVNVPNLPADIASFNDGTDLPMASLKVTVTPYQDLSHGDPSPENICPIIGWDKAVVMRCGKNLFDKSDTKTGVLKADGSVGAGVTKYVSGYIKISPNTSYYLTDVIPANDGRSGFWYDANKNPIEVILKNPPTLTSFAVASPSNAEYIRIGCYIANVETCQLELGDTATTYSPYNGATYTIDLDGTRYGGEVDATNGTMTVDRVMAVLDGSSDEAWDMAQGAFFIDNIFNWDSATSATNPVCLCNMYGEENAVSSSSQVPTRSDFSFFNQTKIKGRLWVKDSKYSTVEEFKTALANNPLQVVYPLATPITVQLAPTPVKSLEGENKIFANCGQITEGKYFKRA